MTRTTQAKALVLAVFAVGMMTGLLLASVYETRAMGGPDRGATRSGGMSRHREWVDYLDLTSEQRVVLDAIMGRTEQRYRELRAETRPRYSELNRSSRDEIRLMLNPEQLARYEIWIEEERARRASRIRDPR